MFGTQAKVHLQELLVGLTKPQGIAKCHSARARPLRRSSMASSASAVELAGLSVALDLAIEAIGLERLEPGAEFRVLVGRQAGDGFLKVFDAHNANIICDFSHSNEFFSEVLIAVSVPRHCAGRARRQPEQPLPQLQKSAADAL